MKLETSKRTKKVKSALSIARYEGNIPAVLYSSGKENIYFTIQGAEFQALLRKIPKGRLSTTFFDLEVEGKSIKALVKEIQYDRTSYAIIHIDFQELREDLPIKVNVPVEFSGVPECAGVKAGGFLRQVKRQLQVKCLPKDLPKEFIIDVKDLGIGQSKRVKDLHISGNIKALAPMGDVLVTIGKR